MDNEVLNDVVVNVWETGITPEDALKRSHNGMAIRKEYETIPWKNDADIYNPAELVGIVIVTAAPTLQVGDTKKISVEPNPLIANLPELCWESSDMSVAWVDSEGVVHAVSEGTANITASKPESNIKATISVTVTSDGKPNPEDLGDSFAYSAETATATATGELANAPTLTNTNNVEVTYSSTDTNVATVSDSGVVTVIANGTTTIKASFAGNEQYLAKEVSYVLTVTIA